jgi:hypothetical protein
MGKRLIVAFVAAGLSAGSSKAQTVVLTSDPPGATILLRGAVEVGRTPLSLHLGSAHETDSIPLTEYCRYSEFRNIPSSGSELAPCLHFFGKNSEYYKRGKKGQWRGVRLESSRREMRFCNSFRRPFLIAGPAATQMRVPLAALGFRRTAIHFCFCRQLD